jgi:hypothetical protein
MIKGVPLSCDSLIVHASKNRIQFIRRCYKVRLLVYSFVKLFDAANRLPRYS